MTDITPITVALYGFGKERKPIMESAFETADKWTIPWKVISSIEDARVVIVELAPESDYKEIEKLEQDLPTAEIVALSTIKPPYAKWHLTWQPSGKVAIIEFSKLVLKISHSLKKKLSVVPKRQIDEIADLAKPNIITVAEPTLNLENEGFDQESSDFLPFFNTLDSLLESKPNEKRKRFNEPS